MRLESRKNDFSNITDAILLKAGLVAKKLTKLKPRLAVYGVDSALSEKAVAKCIIEQNFPNVETRLSSSSTSACFEPIITTESI